MNTIESVISAWDAGPGVGECASHDWKGGLQIRFASGGFKVIGDYLRIETILECLEEAVRRGEIPAAAALEEITFF